MVRRTMGVVRDLVFMPPLCALRARNATQNSNFFRGRAGVPSGRWRSTWLSWWPWRPGVGRGLGTNPGARRVRRSEDLDDLDGGVDLFDHLGDDVAVAAGAVAFDAQYGDSVG